MNRPWGYRGFRAGKLPERTQFFLASLFNGLPNVSPKNGEDAHHGAFRIAVHFYGIGIFLQDGGCNGLQATGAEFGLQVPFYDPQLPYLGIVFQIWFAIQIVSLIQEIRHGGFREFKDCPGAVVFADGFGKGRFSFFRGFEAAFFFLWTLAFDLAQVKVI